MRVDSLVSPGILAQGYLLRRTAAQAISSVEITAKSTPGGKTQGAKTLKAFFDACSAALTALVDAALPTVLTRVRTAANTVVVTFNESLATSNSVPLSAFVFTPARVVTAVVVTGTTVTITATGAIVGDTVTYTKPADQLSAGGTYNPGIKDLAGNAAATFTGVLA
jgi:hypothetical protein